MKTIIGWLLICSLTTACSLSADKNKNRIPQAFEGDYVTPGYFQRNEGYDWVAVSIRIQSDTTAAITVRSRNDIKKPTCTFNGNAYRSGNDTLVVKQSAGDIYFVRSADTVSISSNVPSLLHFYCSGGGSLAGDYVKLKQKLDSSQLRND